MPTRILFRLCFWVGLMAPLCAFALGVGPLEVRSTLNQTFEAELPLMVSNPTELTGLAVRIPRQEEFDRAGVERLALLSKLRFAVQTPPGGPNVVRITSIEPIREPNFNLLLEVVWPRGRLIREFTVQLDPELYANRKPPPPPPPPPVAIPAPVAAAAPPVAAAPAVPQLPPAPPVSFEGASFYGPIRRGETLTAVANRVRPSTAVSIPQMMAILIAGNPAAFSNGNPNTLRVGVTLKVPTPQALGMQGAPPPAATDSASAPPPAPELAVTPPPADTTTTAPSPAPIVTTPEPVTPLPPPVEPASTPPPTAAPPAVAEAPPVAPLPPAEPLQEIVPRAAIPEPEPSPASVTATPPAPETVTPPAAAPPVPETVASPTAAPPAAAPPPAVAPAAEIESESWMSNPVVWLAILLIALAIAAMVLLPLLRRPARPKPTPDETAAPSDEASLAAVEPPSAAPAQTRARESRSVRPRPAASLATAAAAHAVSTAAATPDRIEPAPGSAGAAKPRPIEELLKDFEFGAGEGAAPPAARQGAATPSRDIKAPLLEAEPPTASVTRRPVNPFAETPAEAPESGKETPSQLRAELPSELRLDGLDFDFGDLGLDKTARLQPAELPALEMKPVAAATAGKPVELPPLELGIAEPATEPPSLVSTPSKPTEPRPADLKFEFTDVTQELGRPDPHEDAFNLDNALQGLGGDTLKLGGKADAPSRTLDASDYVETKLDLASAYLDMGDQVGARSLLEDVMQEGSAAQKGRAAELLKKLG